MSTQAIIKACSVDNSVKNTGKECDIAMVATAMLIALDPTVTFTLTDLADPVTWLTGLIQQRKAFPLFGFEAPIRNITNEAENDLIVTLDDGLKVFMRYGIYTRTYETTSGGLCYAKALASFLNSGFRIIEIDQQGQFMARKNNDGTYSGLITDFMYSPAPKMADFKTNPYLNRFQTSQSPLEIVNNGAIFKNAIALLSMMGLTDTEFSQQGAGTTTKLKFGLSTDCKATDLVALLGADLADVDLWIVTNHATGVVLVMSAAAIVSGHIELTGTFVSGQTYDVIGSTPAVWAAQGIPVTGYDASATGATPLSILIP